MTDFRSATLEKNYSSLPLDGSGGLGCEVVEASVDSIYLVGDALGDSSEYIVGDLLDRGGHGIDGVDCTDDHGPLEAPLVVLDTDGLEIGDDGEVLPYLSCESCLIELFSEDCIGFPDGLESVTGYGSGTTDTESGSGEGLSEDHVVGKSQFLTDDTYLVLEQELDRFHELELHVIRESTDIVVCLDGAALEDVWIDGTLCKEIDSFEFACLLLEDTDELCTDDLPLGLRFRYACKLVQESVRRVDVDEVGIEFLSEDLYDLLGLTLTKKSVVDVNACKLLSYCLDEKCCDDGRVHSTGECEQYSFVSDLCAKLCDLFVDELLG